MRTPIHPHRPDVALGHVRLHRVGVGILRELPRERGKDLRMRAEEIQAEEEVADEARSPIAGNGVALIVTSTCVLLAQRLERDERSEPVRNRARTVAHALTFCSTAVHASPAALMSRSASSKR